MHFWHCGWLSSHYSQDHQHGLNAFARIATAAVARLTLTRLSLQFLQPFRDFVCVLRLRPSSRPSMAIVTAPHFALLSYFLLV